jgi:phosphoenolpyruvate-protein kinase (PTS system EI component)
LAERILTGRTASPGLALRTVLCAVAAGDPVHIPALLQAGVRSLSVNPTALARTKLAIAQTVLP